MKKTAIEDKDKIQAVLDEVQKRAKVRFINYEKMVEALNDIDENLKISKSAKKGIRVSIDLNAQSFPNCYHGRPESTFFEAEYNGKTWMIVNMWRGFTRTTCKKAVILTLTDAARAAIIERFETMEV